MSKILVDSSVIIDVIKDDPTWGTWSKGQIFDAMSSDGVVINPIIYAEISISFSRIEDLDTMLADDYEREPLPWSAGFLAGRAFIRYRRAGGVRTALLPDFYIGAHAAVRGYRLLTRNRKDFHHHFPSVDIIAP